MNSWYSVWIFKAKDLIHSCFIRSITWDTCRICRALIMSVWVSRILLCNRLTVGRILQHISAFYMLFKCRRRTARWKVGRVIEQRAALSWAAARLLDARSSGRPTAGQAAAAPPHLAYCLLAIHGAAATLPVLSVHSDQSPKYVTWSSYIGTWKVKSVTLNSLSS